ncbi:uncharacterized protein LOC131016962 [Salvia miltiorrhiza]|uniref:uncharacterized protein LOC131016962 n=1 Tax=Salvia miltiorrhiza TaxID=226208 RepID=UPI0025AD83AE|nr:uncharacterized protein LOC131016962 [Salvia miltiorrhiza]
MVKEESGMMTIHIQIKEAGIGQRRRKLSFTTEKSLPLRRIFLDFCYQLNLDYDDIRFRFDGRRLNKDKSAEECEIEDGGVIEAFRCLCGGEESGLITIHIRIEQFGKGQRWRKLSFTTEKSLPMRRIFLDFCDQLNLRCNDFAYILVARNEARSLDKDKTAEEYGIEDGDVIDAIPHMYG